MTNPRHARETDNGRYYEIPGIDRPLISVTNANSVALAKYGLPLWYANQATEAAWNHVPQMVTALRNTPCGIQPVFDPDPDAPRPCGACRDCVTREVKGAAEQARDSASALGTRVHALAEAHVLGRKLAPEEGDDEAGLYVDQYLRFLADFDVDLTRDVVSAETTVANAAAGYAGTLDVVLRLPFDGFTFKRRKDGTHALEVKRVDDPAQRGTFLLDLKTSRRRAATQSYPENVLQLAALRHATHLVLPDDELAPMVRGITGTGTVQLRQKSYELIPLPSGTREFDLFKHVLAVADWLHHEWPGEYDYRPVTAAARTKPKRQRKAA